MSSRSRAASGSRAPASRASSRAASAGRTALSGTCWSSSSRAGTRSSAGATPGWKRAPTASRGAAPGGSCAATAAPTPRSGIHTRSIRQSGRILRSSTGSASSIECDPEALDDVPQRRAGGTVIRGACGSSGKIRRYPPAGVGQRAAHDRYREGAQTFDEGPERRGGNPTAVSCGAYAIVGSIDTRRA